MPRYSHAEAHAPGTAASPQGSDADNSSKPKGRRYGFACIPCKQRKVKCSGEQPVCAGCQRKGTDCDWPANARDSESQLLREAKERIRQLEGTLGRQSASGSTTQGGPETLGQPLSAVDSHTQLAIVAVTDPGEAAGSTQRPTHSRPRPDHESDRAKRPRIGSHHQSRDQTPDPSYPTATSFSESSHSGGNGPPTLDPSSEGQRSHDSRLAQSLWYQVGIGEDGGVVYNGPTSRFHAGTLPNPIGHDEDEDSSNSSSHDEAGNNRDDGSHPHPGPASRDRDTTAPETRPESSLAHSSPKLASRYASRVRPPPGHLATLKSHYTLMDSVWTPLIAAKPTMNNTGVDTKTGVALLDIYWTWLHPLHHLVYRPAFVMDLALGGPHCSDFLLLCIFALAARHLPSEATGRDMVSTTGEEYASRARALLLEEMTASTPSIPTIQGLLILGGRQCAMGSSSQGWLYTGMAIRMMQDIGLHLDTTHLAGVAEKWTPTELEVRKRLYNAAYVWDKTLSLALGRPPTLIRRPYPACEIFDKYDDRRLWKPVHAKEVVDSFEPCPSWVTSTLCVFSSLHQITTDMLLLFSRNQGSKQFIEQVADLDARFCRWYAELLDGMKISHASTLSQSPPPHIVSLNLLYHTLHILLRRPFLSESRKEPASLAASHIEQCISHSKSIHEIHTLYTKTFPHRLMTYQVSYCIYTAATVEALELKSASLSPDERSSAAARLTAAVRILQNEADHTPGSGKSLDTIRRLLTEGERPNISSRRHSSRRKRRLTNRSRQRNSVSARDSRPLNQHGQDRDAEGVVIESEQPGPGPPTTNTEGSSEFSLQAGGEYIQGGNATTSMNPSMAEHHLGLNPPLDVYGSRRETFAGQDFGNAFDTSAGGWGLDLGFYGGTDTGAGFHPEAFSYVFAANTELPRMPAPPTTTTPPTTYLYTNNSAW